MSNKDKPLVAKVKRVFKSIDLLDGQRRGEVIFRRAFLLVIVYLILYLIGLLYGETIKNNSLLKASEDTVTVEQDSSTKTPVVGNNETKGQGDTEENREVGKEGIKTTEQVTNDRTDFEAYEVIYHFTQTYNGSRIDNEYYDLLKRECKDPDLLRTVIAISVSESGMGRDLSLRYSNFWGWFKGGNRNYDPSKNQMAKDICTGIRKHYSNIGSDSRQRARYIGHDSSTWLRNFKWAEAQMSPDRYNLIDWSL